VLGFQGSLDRHVHVRNFFCGAWDGGVNSILVKWPVCTYVRQQESRDGKLDIPLCDLMVPLYVCVCLYMCMRTKKISYPTVIHQPPWQHVQG
jgi:hypothetical protein